jgi:hypothetical protein
MNREYQDYVNKKISDLKILSDVIHKNLCDRFPKCTITAEFREKNRSRIVEKDVLDYGRKRTSSFDTEVKDIYAARLCPVHDDKLSDDEAKDNMQVDIKNLFKGDRNINVSVQNKTHNNGMKVFYLVFNSRIELQILTLREYLELKDTRKIYEEERT